MSSVAEDGEMTTRFRGMRKRKWGKYVAEIRSGKRSRISLGSYFTAEAAARAYDTALLCLRGAQASSFNFEDSKFNMEVANVERNPSAEAIRTAAIRVGSACDVVPARYFHNNINQIFEEGEKGLSDEVEEATHDERNRGVEEKMGEQKEVTHESIDVRSTHHTLSDETVQTTFDFMT